MSLISIRRFSDNFFKMLDCFRGIPFPGFSYALIKLSKNLLRKVSVHLRDIDNLVSIRDDGLRGLTFKLQIDDLHRHAGWRRRKIHDGPSFAVAIGAGDDAIAAVRHAPECE